MNAPAPINDLSHDEIRAWLKRALHGKELLPRLTPDESHYLGILRVDKSAKAPARDSLRDGCHRLVHEFCADGTGETAYLEELLSLAASFKDPVTVEELSSLARRFPQLPNMATDVRLEVLATLVDTPPPRSVEFWAEILARNSIEYAPLALSGVLAVSPARAITMLPSLPNTERMGQLAALKLDLAWDTLPSAQRFQFVRDIKAILQKCGPVFAAPVMEWAETKRSTRVPDFNTSLSNALFAFFGKAINAQAFTPKLCPA